MASGSRGRVSKSIENRCAAAKKDRIALVQQHAARHGPMKWAMAQQSRRRAL